MPIPQMSGQEKYGYNFIHCSHNADEGLSFSSDTVSQHQHINPFLTPLTCQDIVPGSGSRAGGLHTGCDLDVVRREITKTPASEYSLVGPLFGRGRDERKGAQRMRSTLGPVV